MKNSPGSFDLFSSDRDLFELLLEEEGVSESASASAIKRNSQIKAPLSFGQARLWFFEQMEPGTAAYNMPGGLRIEGALSVDALAGALLEIVRRQESLRTCFENVDGAGQQVIEQVESIYLESSRYSLRVADVSDLHESQRIDLIQRLAMDEARRPFDLCKAPLFRTLLIRSARRESFLLITMHHIISDEWSLSIFLNELTALYAGFVGGFPSGLEEPAIQYSDIAIWQREWLRDETLEQGIEFWKTALAGAPASIELPADHPRPAVLSYSGGTITRDYPAYLSEALKNVARQRGLTLFMLLLAAYEVLIFRYTGQEDFVIGTPIAGRDRVETHGLIGFFVNMLAIRAGLSAGMQFPRLLGRVRETALAAYANQAVPFEVVVETLQPERDLSRSSLFNVTFSLEQGLPSAIAMPGLVAAPLAAQTGTSKFDLILSIVDSTGGLTASIEYRGDLFDPETIERMMGHFNVLLDAIASGAEGRISSLPLLAAPETHQLLQEWNDTDADYPADRCIHSSFEHQAELRPDAVAIAFEDAQLTYLDLNRRANRLARHLIKRRVRVDRYVGVCLERSLEMAVALLGIMKAGGAYLPLDPNYPQERLGYMISDSGAGWVIAGREQISRLPETADNVVNVINLDDVAGEIFLEDDENPNCGVTTEDPIYIIYTSGSTGKPKGTAVPHKGPLNCICWLQQKFQFGAGDRLLMKASLSFDASVWEIFWPLVTGSTVVMVVPGGEQDSAYLVSAMSRLQVTSCHFVPSMLRPFIDEPSFADLRCLELVFPGGEALPVETMEDFLRLSRAELHNFYGPTETSMGCMDWLCLPSWKRTSVPIGRPISNIREYILDAQLSPVPIGVSGELCISGDGVAFGYVGRPDLTAEKFLPDMIGKREGARMYRSGDLCRFLTDGNIEFLGRIDHQVKIRGFRIELGEIEAALAQHESVRECIVLAREGIGRDDKQLVAYIVAADGDDVSPAVLRPFLKKMLPAFMTPAYFVQLKGLPLTPNGKVNRKALPLPDASAVLTDEFRPPQDAVEELLADIWRCVLRADRVSRDAQFFEQGGHSLLATQVVSRIRDTFRVELPIRALFEHPILSELSRVIQNEISGGVSPVSTPIAIAERGPFVALSHAQERLWFLDQLEYDRAVYNSVAGLRLIGPLSISALEEAVREIVRRHESLRTTFEVHDGEPVQVTHPFGLTTVRIVDVSGLAETERAREILRLARQEASRVFDLQRGPLLRVNLFRAGPLDHALIAFLHHIVSDGWSMGVLTEEIGALYGAFAAGNPSSLSDLPIQYADFALWHRRSLKDGALTSQLDYWRRKLAGAPPVLEMQFDRPRPAVQTFNGATHYFELSESLTLDLHSLARHESATMFMVLLAAFQTLLHRYSGQDDVCVGSPISNRTRKEIEGLIGFFANTLVLRAQFDERPSFRKLLGQVRETMLEAYAHQDLPFEMLVDALQPVRDLRHSPLFQVLFVLQNAPQRDLALPGISAAPLALDAGKAHFDLSLSMMEDKGALQAAIEYNTGLFDETTISRFFAHFEVLLSAISDNSGLGISELPVLTHAELTQLLYEFNDTAREFERAACVHELFERQAESAPDAISLVFESHHVSYECLNVRAEKFAAKLRAEGVGPDALAGICVDRSIEMIMAVIAALKAGAAYVPLDPSYPAGQLAWMIGGLDVLIAQPDLASSLPAHNARVFDITLDCVGPFGDATNSKPTPDNLAYVVHTSGSTGRPKGVAMSHRSAVKMVSWQCNSSEQSIGGRTLQFASLSFDVSFQEIFSTLSTGGTLLLISDDHRKDTSRLLATILSEQVERLFVPVVALHQLSEAAAESCPAPIALREIITAGEQLKITPHVSALFAGLPACRLFNHYGPSETHAATAYTMPDDCGLWPEAPSIGTAIDNTSVYLLDQTMRPVPLGVIGEIYIGGGGLARGYLDQPAMTAERFIPDPFGERSGSLLYSSGDRARYLPDGTIEFLGRSDHQLKIRGYRVEPGEIEMTMREAGWIKQAVVVAREIGPREKQLVAYFVAAEDSQPDLAALKALLKQRLPAYMFPAAFVQLDEMPLTGSGKIDRRRLPAAQDEGSAPDGPAEPFSNVVEEVVAEVLCSALRIDGIALDQSFFDEGGNSLTAAKVISRLRSAFNIDLPLRKIFDSPTVAGLALCIEDEIRGGKPAVPAIISRLDRTRAIPLSFAQTRLWFLTTLAPASAAYNISGAVRIVGALDEDILERAINRIVSRHEILRTSFEEIDGQPTQVIHPGAVFKLERVTIDASRGMEDAWTLALERASQFALNVFDLTKPTLLGGLLIRLDETDHLLVLSMHHIVSDGTSIDLFFRELSALYDEPSSSGAVALPELKIQYADYAAWQREWIQGERLEKEKDYWRRMLAGAADSIQAPIDRPRPLTQTSNGSTIKFNIPAEVERAARRLCRVEGATIFMTLLAAFQALLHKYSGESDISIGVPVANRGLPEIEHLIGFFVNTVVIRARIDRSHSFNDLLRQTRERAIEAYIHQEVPFEQLVEDLHPRRDLRRSPLFQVAFAVSAPSRIPDSLGGLRVEQIEIESRTAKFDLFLSIEDAPEAMTGVIEYNTDLFDRGTIDRLAHHLNVLSQALTAHPEKPLREVSLLSDADVAQLINEWNDTERLGYDDCAFAELFEAVVERSPDAVALVHGDLALTYRALNKRANQLARYLAGAGLGPEQTIALCLNRSADLIAAMLAALKSGVAYLPLDPRNPADRLKMIVDDSNTSFIIGEQDVAGFADGEVPFLGVDAIGERIANYRSDNPAFKPLPRTVAYLMYTSGSTGSPKGVAVEQRNLTSYVRAIIERFDPRAGTSFAALAAPSADLGYTALFPALAAGGCLHIIPEDLFLDADGLAGYFDLHYVDYLKIVPSHLAALQAAAKPGTIMPRTTLVLGGEASNAEWARSLGDAFASVSIVNHYGPTETTVGVSTLALDNTLCETQSNTLPIGRPLANSRLYILSEDLEPVPIGAGGEIHIGGRGVARGYYGHAGATAEKFIPDPFSRESGARMYRSHDAGRYLTDGTIEFLGRRDDQVKVHGYRIEPREIEHQLLAHPDVSQAIVLPRQRNKQSQEIELCAYVVPNRARARTIAGFPRYSLPNNLAIVHINKNETDYIYREIFELQAYLRFGTSVGEGSVVLDVGANIGLFTLFVTQHHASARVLAFEPNPRAFEMLKINASIYAPNARVFNYGLGSREGVAEFTSFSGFTLFSGLYADPKTEKQVVRRFMDNQAASAGIEISDLIESSDELLNERFEPERFSVRLRTLSDVIDENEIDRIDLLKINVEKSELEVLRGVRDEHWARIHQIVLEVDLKENLSRITEMLNHHGYEMNVLQDKVLAGTELSYVYARRSGRETQTRVNENRSFESKPNLPNPFLTPEEIETFLAERLPDYMMPRAIVILDSMPTAPNGKIDRAALPELDEIRMGREEKFIPPGNSLERAVASVWQEVLGVENISVNADFFSYGGNSLLLAQVCSKLRRAINPELTVMELFRYPTVHALAKHLSGNSQTISNDSPQQKRGLDRRSAVGLRGSRRRNL